MNYFRPHFIFVSPDMLALPAEYRDYCEEHHIPTEYSHELTPEIIAQTDILYMTRIQRERFTDDEDYEAVKDSFILRADMLRSAKETMRVLHPLPRVNEIAMDVDRTKYAYYFTQAQNGLYVREALICRALNIPVTE